MKWKLLVSIVPRGTGVDVATAAAYAGAGGGSVLLGSGTAPNAVLQFLGLGESAREITLNLTPEVRAASVADAIRAEAARTHAKGLFFAVDAFDVARGGDGVPTEKEEVEMDAGGRMAIVAIVNKDYAEDAMAEARKAGAGGGTILQARGTAREGDAAFFGVKLVPEKEVLVIVAEMDRFRGILEAIRKSPAFAEKGSGIVFTVRAEDVSMLGG